MTTNNAYNLYLAHAKADRRYAAETLVKLEDCFKNWILPHLGSLELTELSLRDVTNLNTAMVSRGVSATRQYGVLMWLKLFLRFSRDYLKQLALDPTQVRLPKRPEPTVVFLTNEEVAKVLGVIPLQTASGKRLRALIELLLGTGLRISEALSLERRPFDERQPMISIVGKGGRRRNIHVTERVLRWVHYYLASRHDSSADLFVTTGVMPTRLARADISRFFRRLKSDAQISKPFTPHILRHTYCTNLLNNGVDIRFIRDLAGHRDIATTARYYLGVDEGKLQELVRTKLSYETDEQAAP